MKFYISKMHHSIEFFFGGNVYIVKKTNHAHLQGDVNYWFPVIDNRYSAVNPFLSVHIPYVQSEGILSQIRLLQWRAYIFRNTQCFSTKLGRNMVNTLFCHKTLKYWWPLTYIQGHVIQDGCQIQSEKSILSQKIAITRPIFDKFDNFFFVLLLNTSSIL